MPVATPKSSGNLILGQILSVIGPIPDSAGHRLNSGGAAIRLRPGVADPRPQPCRGPPSRAPGPILPPRWAHPNPRPGHPRRRRRPYATRRRRPGRSARSAAAAGRRAPARAGRARPSRSPVGSARAGRGSRRHRMISRPNATSETDNAATPGSSSINVDGPPTARSAMARATATTTRQGGTHHAEPGEQPGMRRSAQHAAQDQHRQQHDESGQRGRVAQPGGHVDHRPVVQHHREHDQHQVGEQQTERHESGGFAPPDQAVH